jgi:hypothetical protein
LGGSALPDLVVANRGSFDISILLDPAAPLAEEIRIFTGGIPRTAAIGDLDGDGDADIVVGRETSHPPLVIVRNEGGGTFAEPQPLGSFILFADEVRVADLDADGDQDIVLASGPSSKVIVFLNDGTGVFTETLYNIIAGPSYPSDAAVGDVDDDGDLDVLITASLSQLPPALLLNVGDGTFTNGDPFTTIAGEYVSGAIGVMAGDGNAELVMLRFSSGTIDVFPHEGGGAFGDPVSYSIGASTQPGGRVRLADLNSDGHLDAAVGLFMQNPSIPVLLADGAGGFEPAQHFPTGAGGISGIALADLDADGDLDVAATSTNEGVVVVLRNLTSPTSVPGGSAAADFALLPPRPNPGPTPTIAFHLPRPAHVRLCIYDLAGRLVARLIDAPRLAGEHSVLWPGTGENGARVSSGVYTVRLETEGFRDQRKIVLTR